MFFMSKSELDVLKEAVKPNCPKCSNKAIHYDWGPIVGSGYYCQTCKDDVEHPDNVYGAIAMQKRATLLQITEHIGNVEYKLNCTKVGCKTCAGSRSSLPPIGLLPGDIVICTRSMGTNNKLIAGQSYKVVRTEPGAVRIQVGIEQLAYTRCRFNKYVKESKVA